MYLALFLTKKKKKTATERSTLHQPIDGQFICSLVFEVNIYILLYEMEF